MADRGAKDDLFGALARAARALGNGRRAELVDVLAQGERSVDELAAQIGQSVANTSHHLQQLLGAGLVTTRRERNRIYYSLAGPAVADLWASLQHVAAAHVDRLDELAEAYLGDRSGLRSITREELQQRIVDGDVIVLDVRPLAEYAAGHVATAVSVPLEDLSRRLSDVPVDKQVVAYCRGQFCVYADEAIRRLHTAGHDALRLEDGFPEWQRAGYPVSSSTART